jgi:hypothetical protein
MPGIKRRSVYRKGVKSRDDFKRLMPKWPQLSEQDWLVLEKTLGSKLTANQRMMVDRFTAYAKAQENLVKSAITITELIKKIRKVRRTVLAHRGDIWHIYRPRALETTLSISDVDELFFMKRFRTPQKGESPLELLSWAMDALIMTCLSIEHEMKDPDQSMKERDSIIAIGASLRVVFRKCGLPSTIRKDVDKIKTTDSSGSRFLDFYIEVLKRIDCAWPFDSSALATAISRHDLSKYYLSRVHGGTGKGRK